ncbi:hypothetical protein DXG03_000564 [Asterophora parasitica]|uniref:GNAT family N-acetyltransferase n=1 Tax=Asterophora parasitica TaxID=117018 RepID=A0A9P7G7M2_9AGAR|nr:hypothetical protein DXG03_000564 [Asterophora parasitica]
MVASFHIRPAIPEDTPVLLQLIIDLAQYENSADSAKATPEILRQNLFETPFAHALLAFSGPADAPGEAIGVCVYFFNFSTWTGRPGLYVRSFDPI